MVTSTFAGAIRTAILECTRQLADMGISEEDFLRMKRSAMGRRIRDLDSFDSTCFRMCAYHFDEFDYFQFPKIYEEVTVAPIKPVAPFYDVVDDMVEYILDVIAKEKCPRCLRAEIEEVLIDAYEYGAE